MTLTDNKLRLYLTGEFPQTLKKFTNSWFYETNLEQCDFIFYHEMLTQFPSRILSQPAQMARKLKSISARFKDAGKKIIVVVLNDYENEYPLLDNLILLRMSMRASKKRENEFSVPYLFECKTKPFAPSEPVAKPTVGYCGWIKKRRKILNSFEMSEGINTCFITRKHFWGGDPQNQDLIKEFYENLRSNQFNISQRGAGNFSMRFYQTLAVGRIPVLVDTDMELPLADEIPWRDIIVLEDSEKACVERVIACHEEGKVSQMQVRCADTFHTYLSPQSYFPHLSNRLRVQFIGSDIRRAI